jgi:hypothetical protein
MTKSESNTGTTSSGSTTNVNLNLEPLRNIILIVAGVIVVSLIVFIVITIFAHRARVKCSKNMKYSFYATLILAFLLCMWLGGLIPYVGPVISTAGLIGSIVMIVLAKNRC